MSPLLGRPGLSGRHLLLRELLLMVGLLLASAPMSGLLAGSSWFTLTASGAVPVVVVGYVARRLLRHALWVPLLQLAMIIVLVLAIELQQGLISLGDGPVGVITAQAEIFPAAVNELASGLAPMTVGARGTVIVVLLVALITLALDLMFIDLGWHTPSGIILAAFVLVPALQQPSGGPWWTVAGPVLAALLILSVRTVHADPSYLQGDRRPQAGPLPRRVRTGGAVLAVSALVAGLAAPVGPLLPQIANPQIALNIDVINQWQNRDLPQLGPVMIDDDVSVRRSLLNQDPVEVLRYTTTDPEPSYLRLRTLNAYDGEAFQASDDGDAISSAAFSDARTDGMAIAGSAEDLHEYDVTVSSLGGDRLPAPKNLRDLQVAEGGDEEDLQVRPAAGEIAIEGGGVSATGLNYTMETEESPADAEALRDVDPAVFEEPFEVGYTSREDVPQVTEDLAASVAEDAGAETAFDTAIAFQEYFRNSFAYSLTVRSPPGQDPLESFLSDRVGYCEQFAAAFALMMTAQGYPTRVAIGFTAGQRDGEEWVVESTNAHAWPEVWFGPEYGWVQFEPTPAAANNGVRPNASTDPTPEETEQEDAPPTTAEPEEPVGEETTSEEDPAGSEEEDAAAGEETTDGATGEATERAISGAVSAALVIGALAAIGAAVAAAGVIMIRRRRTARREERWAAFMAGAAGGAAGTRAADETSESEESLAAEAERLRRGAGRMAWSEIEWELKVRDIAIRWLGFTGSWGWPPRRITLDAALPPARALDQMLDQVSEGDLTATEEHSAAAARIASAFTAARYAAPVEEPSGAETPSTSHSIEPEDAEAAQDEGRQHPLRDDADLLIALIRRAR